MKISARVQSGAGSHRVFLRTGEYAHAINIPPKSAGLGSSVNGGELLFLALATCYCNDVFREAAKRGIAIQSVEVEVEGESGAEGEPLRFVSYRARVNSKAPEEDLRRLMYDADRVAEIHNTLRAATPVTLSQVEILGG